jgi:hypothetical protein
VNRIIYPPFTAMGLERDGRIVCGAVFNCFTGFDCHLTIAAEQGAITRRFLKEMGRYVGEQMGCHRITLVTEQPYVIDLAKRLGAQTEGRIRNHFGPGRHALLLGILKEEWIFNGKRSGT